jgi:hypothetical protein
MTSRLVVVAGVVGFLLLPAGARAFSHVGSGAFGASAGADYFLADEDSKEGVKTRPILGAFFEYSPSERRAFRLDASVGWVGYPPDKTPGVTLRDPHPVKIIWPTTLSVIHRFRASTNQPIFIGAGVGLYYWKYRISGKDQRDPVTQEVIKSGKVLAFDPGVHALVGYEYPLTSSLSLQGEGLAHYVFSENTEDRPDKTGTEFADFPVFNGNDFLVAARVSLKLYFDIHRFDEPDEEIY